MNLISYNDLIFADIFPWDCLAQGEGKNLFDSLVNIKEYQRTNGNIRVKIKDFSSELSSVCAKRVEIATGDNALFIMDKISSPEPINLKTAFWIKGGVDLRCNIAEKNKLVLRNNGKATKFFRLSYLADGSDILQTAGLMLPDRFLNSEDMGLTYYSGLHHTAKEHAVLYGICSDTEQDIPKWHFKYEDGFVIRPPRQMTGYRLVVSQNQFFVEQLDASMAKVDILEI